MILALCAGSWAADKGTAAKADRILIVKSTRTLTLLNHGQVLKTYQVALGGDPAATTTTVGAPLLRFLQGREPRTRALSFWASKGLHYTVTKRNLSPACIHLHGFRPLVR